MRLTNPSDVIGYTVVTALGVTSVALPSRTSPLYTSNEAELYAIVAATEIAEPGSVIVTDSQIAQKWATWGRCPARPNLTPHALKAKRLLMQKALTLQWRPRGQNLAGHWNDRQRPTLS